MPSRLASACAVTATIGVVACSAIAGLGDRPVVDAGVAVDASGGGGSSGSVAACEACAASRCSAQSGACRASTACAGYEDCLLACGGDYACRSTCLVSSYANAPEIPAMDQCVSAECPAECGLTCAMPNVYSEPDAAVACQQCIEAYACGAAQACAGDVACGQVTQCTLGCATEDCLFACGSAVPGDAGLADFVAYAAAGERCAGQCGVGSFWDCPASAMPPLSQTGRTEVTLNLVAFPSMAPLDGATVKACVRSDVECSSPAVAPGVTSATGDVTFTLVTDGPFGFDGYFEVTSASATPSLFFLRDPLSVPRVTFPGVLLPEPSYVAGLYASLGRAADPSRGTVELQATDCHFGPASGVTARLVDDDGGTPDGAPFRYFLNGQLSSTATATDGSGYAILLDAPAGVPLAFAMTPPGRAHAMPVRTIFARAGTWSYALVRP